MSTLAIARSSLATSLTRYSRSWGLWLLLLVAPVGARLMISNEDGQGIAIAINSQLPVLTSSMLGVWLGIVVSTLLLPVGYIYLRANTTRRQPWQVEEVTGASRVAIMLGRYAADVAILFAMLAALTFAGWFLGWLMISGPLNLWAITFALWIIAAPALMGIAAIRLVFDAVPWLRGGLGDFAYFMIWIATLIMPILGQNQPSGIAANMSDFPGFMRPLTGPSPAAEQDIAIGGTALKPGRIALDVDAGLSAPGYLASRGLWALVAVTLVVIAGLIYRPHKPRARAKGKRWIGRLLANGPPPAVNPGAVAAPRVAMPLAGLAIAEFRLIGAGKLFKLLAGAAAVAGLFGDFRHGGSAASLLLLVFALSAHAGRSEARGLLALTQTASLSAWARRAAFVGAGLGWALLMAVPAALVRLSIEPVLLNAVAGGAAALVAMALATISGSGFAGRMVLLILWYGYLSS